MMHAIAKWIALACGFASLAVSLAAPAVAQLSPDEKKVLDRLLESPSLPALMQRPSDLLQSTLQGPLPSQASSLFGLFSRALTSFNAKSFDQAIAEATQALERDPNFEPARMLRAHAYIERAQYDQAASDFHKFLETSPDDQSAAIGLHVALHKGAKKEPFTARLVRLATLACEPSCPEWISLQGSIEPGSASQLKSLLKVIGSRKVPVFVDSLGGSVNDAFEIGRAIRAKGLDVIVTRTKFAPACATDDRICKARTANGRFLGTPHGPGTVCASSCAFLLASGVQRYVGPSTLVGVHQLTSFQTTQQVHRQFRVFREMRDGKIVETGRELISETKGAKKTVQTATSDELYAKVRKYFTEMAIDESVIELLVSAPPKDMRWISAKELDALKLRTAAVHGEQLLMQGKLVPEPSTGKLGEEQQQAKSPVQDQPVGLIRDIQLELARLRCGVSDEKTWGTATRKVLDRYNLFVGKPLKSNAPSQETLDALKERSGPVCPQSCPPELDEYMGRCVAKGPAGDADRAAARKVEDTGTKAKPAPNVPIALPATTPSTATDGKPSAQRSDSPQSKVAAKVCRTRPQCEADCFNGKIEGYRGFNPPGTNITSCVQIVCTRFPATC